MAFGQMVSPNRPREGPPGGRASGLGPALCSRDVGSADPKTAAARAQYLAGCFTHGPTRGENATERRAGSTAALKARPPPPSSVVGGCWQEPHGSGTHLPRREAPPPRKARIRLGSPERGGPAAQEKVLAHPHSTPRAGDHLFTH